MIQPDSQPHHMHTHHHHPNPKSKPSNPILTAFTTWLTQLPPEISSSILSSALTETLPKRWVVYPPMLLLPSGTFASPAWAPVLALPAKHSSALWTAILACVGKREGKGPLTHLAVNAGIPLTADGDGGGAENVMRTPSGLLLLHGDFGPALAPAHPPSARDFAAAFWVRTRQNGIEQVWAPRYTMFSRGNVKEKARVLGFAAAREEGGAGGERAVDLYAGIGYFVFSYRRRGFRVLGWEVNAWSVEGLRRGAVANGWSVAVVGSEEEIGGRDEGIVVVLEDNARAAERLGRMRAEGEVAVKHVNLGLLPSCQSRWEDALNMVEGDGWLHLHENVGVDDIDARAAEIETLLKGMLKEGDEKVLKVEHVERVKTFAPGVWHCVFDVRIGIPP